MHLTAEGTVNTIPRRGFFIRSLEVEEFENLYAIRALLDTEALRLGGIPDATRLRRLEELNTKLARARTASRRIELDNKWHLELIGGCPNRVLVDLVRQFVQRTRRYEMALLREQQNAQITLAEHKEILAALRAGNLQRACAALRQNMHSGREPIIRWLERRQKNKR
jgi:DNA-binding GntR family transcriptional regulator